MQQLLLNSNYDKQESEFVIKGLRYGFDIGYEGDRKRRDFSKNLKFRDGVGSKEDLWEKMSQAQMFCLAIQKGPTSI